jgi:hypothetical protein
VRWRRTSIWKNVSLPAKRGPFRQFECAEMEFLCRVRVCRCHGRRFDERKHRIRELLPDSKIIRRNREPPEPEHVTARLGYVSHLLPGDFIDRQSFCPSEGRKQPLSLRGTGFPGLLIMRSPLCVRISKASSCKTNVASASLRLFSSSIRASSLGFMASFACGLRRAWSIDGTRCRPAGRNQRGVHATFSGLRPASPR